MKIEPCPFCECDCEIDFLVVAGHDFLAICTGCSYRSSYHPTKEQAIEAHNRVAGLKAENDRLKKQIVDMNDHYSGEHCERHYVFSKDEYNADEIRG